MKEFAAIFFSAMLLFFCKSAFAERVDPIDIFYSDLSVTNPWAGAIQFGVKYPRMVELQHNGAANGTLLATFEEVNDPRDQRTFPVYQSTDHGKSWSLLSKIKNTQNGWGFRSQPQLYELPDSFGTLPAGTLLAAAIGEPNDFSKISIELFASRDQGATWTYLSTILSQEWNNGVNDGNGHNIWEPFLLLHNGTLICYFADERNPEYSQAIVHVTSTDGIQWSPVTYDVALKDPKLRPGMPTVARLGDGNFILAYEMIGLRQGQVHYKISADPLHWGPATEYGTALEARDGVIPYATPYVTYMPNIGPNGMVIVSSQFESTGDQVGGDYFVNYNNGKGYWYRMASPVWYNTAGGQANNRAGYSFSSVPSMDHLTLYTISDPRYEGTRLKITFAAQELGIQSGQMYKLTAESSGKIWTISGTEDNAPVTLAIDKEKPGQKFEFVSDQDGYYKLINKNSGKLVTLSDGSLVQMNDSNSPSQRWLPRQTETGEYELINQASGSVLTVQDGDKNNSLWAIMFTNKGSRFDVQFQLDQPRIINAFGYDGKVELSWNTTFGASKYTVKRSTNKGGPYTELKTVATRFFTDTTVENGKTYYYVVSAANYVKQSGNSPEVRAVPTADVLPLSVVNVLSTAPKNIDDSPSKVFDHDWDTYFESTKSDVIWVGADLGAAQKISTIRYAARFGYNTRMVGGIFQGANKPDFSDAVQLGDVSTTPAEGFNSLAVSNDIAFRYVRYVSLNGQGADIAELELYGTVPGSPTGASLSNLFISQGTLSPAFSSVIKDYSAVVANVVSSIDITPTATVLGYESLTVNGKPVVSGIASSVNLEIGENRIPVVITALDGTTATYTIVITREAAQSSNATLSNLIISQCTLSPAFTSEHMDYTAMVENSVSTIDITPTVTSPSYRSLTVNGESLVSGAVSRVNLAVGANTIPVAVTAQDGTIATYTIVVTRDADHSHDNFNTMPTGSVPVGWGVNTSVGTVTVQDVPSTTDKSVLINKVGAATGSKTSLYKEFSPLSGTVVIEAKVRRDSTTNLWCLPYVYGSDGTTMAATIQFDNGTIKAYSDGGWRTIQPFTAGTWYDLKLVINTDTNKFDFYINGVQKVTQGTLRNAVSVIGKIEFYAADFNAGKTYVDVEREPYSISDATLRGLEISSGTLSPSFAPNEMNYKASVAGNATSVGITPTVSASVYRSLTVNGVPAASGSATTVELAVGVNDIPVVIISQDGTTATYMISITRKAVQEEPTIVSIQPVYVSTTAGTAPVLPGTVTVTYSDNTTTDAAVQWAAISPSQYAQAGSFEVTGAVVGTAIPATAIVTVTDPVDMTAPVTIVTASAADGRNDWYVGSPTVTLTAADDLSGVKQTLYRIDNGAWETYSQPVTIAMDGIHTLEYKSVDRAGNEEAVRSLTLKVDKAAPTLNVVLDKDAIWPPNHKMVTVTANVYATDIVSQVDSIVLVSITSSEPDGGPDDGDEPNDIQGAEFSTFDTSFQLRAERLGGAGRVYTVTYMVTDKAGNKTTISATVKVPHDQSGKEK